MNHCSSRQNGTGLWRGSAFTLIELLVVIAIIALLLSILLPSLQSARNQGKRSVCLHHVKHIAATAKVYEADDPNGWGIPMHWKFYQQTPTNMSFIGAYQWGGKAGIGGPYEGTSKPENSKRYGTKFAFGPAERPLNDLLYPQGLVNNRLPTLNLNGAIRDTKLELDVFRCPSDDGPPRVGHCAAWISADNGERSSYDHFGTSYAANIFMTFNPWNDPDVHYAIAKPIYSNSPYMRPMSRIPNPTRTLFFEENIGRYAWAAMKDPCPDVPGISLGTVKTIRGWHGQDWTYNRAFSDGHAAYQRVVVGEKDSQGYYNHYRMEWFDDTPEGRTWQDLKCVIVRGDGWQKDTLPAPRIPTHLVAHSFGGLGLRAEYEDCVGTGLVP